MSKNTIEVKSVLDNTRNFCNGLSKALNGLVDLEDLPDAGKRMIQDVMASLNATIEKLPPIEQVAGATDAKYLVNDLAMFIRDSGAMFEMFTKMVDSLKGQLVAQNEALPGLVEKEINQRITNGDLMKKEDVTNLVNSTRQTALNEAAEEQKKLKARKDLLATNGIPETDLALNGTDEEFNSRIEEVKPRLAELKKRNLEPKGAMLHALFGPRENFDGQLQYMDEILPGGKAPARKPGSGTTPNPMAAGSGNTPSTVIPMI